MKGGYIKRAINIEGFLLSTLAEQTLFRGIRGGGRRGNGQLHECRQQCAAAATNDKNLASNLRGRPSRTEDAGFQAFDAARGQRDGQVLLLRCRRDARTDTPRANPFERRSKIAQSGRNYGALKII